MIKLFTDKAWEEYLYWQSADRRILQKINALLQDIDRNGNEGIGKPEPLKHEMTGYWSRRITSEHRLIYAIDAENITILQCRSHYDGD